MSLGPVIKRTLMATPPKESRKVLEGIIAVNKPQWASSAGVLRDLQNHFSTSDVLKPWLDYTRRNLIESQAKPKHLRNLNVKLGHGGTLDPLATGVLIVGVGKGTKLLGRFLDCTKSYECVVVFGAATDSYDVVGKVVSKADYSHVTKELVESKLADFRGKIMQKPSVFSALKVDGKKMYEYARAGGPIPEVAARPVEVTELELVEWLEPGTHEYMWPKEEMGSTEQEGAEKLLGIRKSDADAAAAWQSRKRSRTPEISTEDATATKKPRIEEEAQDQTPTVATTSAPQDGENDDGLVTNADEHPRSPSSAEEPAMSGALVPPPSDPPATTTTEPSPPQAQQQQHPQEQEQQHSSTTPAPQQPNSPGRAPSTEPPPQHHPPAARLRMTVTSGFYVRSLCHDLGLACSSLACMASLIRTRQGAYELGKNVIDYNVDFKHADGKAHWDPLVRQRLEESMTEEGWTPEEVDSEEAWEERRKAEGPRKSGGSGGARRGGGGYHKRGGGWRGR
ncbi:unnamed protein product [Periconia digitata]|uniref:tRNA pseudouridine(55) synthase n=1 Tax=Periconia digitata TaxID=1303443 RepID=A0A9W4US46_9PLEO|nr:unnamed protein product [Periconia digitata]